MKSPLFSAAVLITAGVLSANAQTLPGAPETNGITPKTLTAYINGTNTINNTKSESLSIDIASNGNMIIGWEDDGDGLADIESVWTLLDPNGSLVTPQTVVSNRSILGALTTLETITTSFLSYYRSDNTTIPGYTGWGPKVKANRFGDGIGMGAMPWEIGLEVPELYAINEDEGGPPPDANDFVCVQLLNNDGTPLRPGTINGITNLGIVTFADADVQPAGAIRIGGWDYLSTGNILIVGESRQGVDTNLTGQATGRVPVYRVITPGGVQVKGYSAVSSTPDAGNISRNGAAVTTSGFAIRWQGGPTNETQVRLFDNAGNPVTTNLDLAALTRHPEAAGGGDGGSHGISGNGKDAYVISGDYSIDGTNGVWVTVLNANGTVRWSKDVANDMILTAVSASSAAIDESGQVIVVFAAKVDPSLPSRNVMGRRFDAAGKPAGGTFYISEAEVPDLSGTLLESGDPKVAWRNGKIAVAWLTKNYPLDASLTGTTVIAYRLFVSSPLPGAPENNGLTVKTPTHYVNGTNTINNGNSESLSIDIASNGNMIVGWEDDGSDLADIESVWTLLDPNGNLITPQTVVSNRSTLGALGTLEVTNTAFLSYYRADNTSIPGHTGWGPKVKANRFGDGIGMGAMPWEIGLEVPELYDINEDEGGPPPDANDFVCVQLLNNDGTPFRPGVINGITNLGIVTFAEADVQPAGAIRIGGWDYLSTGNILIVGESRQGDDYVLTGQSGGRTPVYRIVTPGGVQFKAYSAVSSTPDAGNISRNGATVTTNGFAIRWQGGPVNQTQVRLFDNAGNPVTTNLDLATLTGRAEAAGGGDGGSHGISGNGKDAYVISGDYNINGNNGVWVTVLNANGTVRWSTDAADDKALNSVSASSAAIDESGQVIVVFAAKVDPAATNRCVMGRRFDATGKPAGGTFYISEAEVPDLSGSLLESGNPKVAWRNGQVAVTWLTRNYPLDSSLLGSDVIAYRLFTTSSSSSAPSLSVSRSSNSITISWPADVTGYVLESSGTLATGAIWNPVSGVVNNSVTVVNPTGTQFYRLKK